MISPYTTHSHIVFIHSVLIDFLAWKKKLFFFKPPNFLLYSVADASHSLFFFFFFWTECAQHLFYTYLGVVFVFFFSCRFACQHMCRWFEHLFLRVTTVMNNWKLSQFVETISKSRAHATFVLSASSQIHWPQPWLTFSNTHIFFFFFQSKPYVQIRNLSYLYYFSFVVFRYFAHSQKQNLIVIKE